MIRRKVIYSITDKEMEWEDLEKERLYKTFVVGLPRTGTSLMVGICEALGVEMIYNQGSDIKEIGDQFFTHVFELFMRPNTGCKLPLIEKNMWTYLDLIRSVPCKILYTDRDMNETIQSQLKQGYRYPTKAALRGTWQLILDILLQQRIPTLVVNYNALLKDPEKEIRAVADFLKFTDIDKAVRLVNPELYHFRTT